MRVRVMKAMLSMIMICPFLCMGGSIDTLTTRIRIFDTTNKNYPVKITLLKLIGGGDSVLLNSTFASTQQSFFLKLSRATFASLETGEKYYPIYLSPGDKLDIHFNGSSLLLEGSGAALNTCMVKIDSARRAFGQLNGKSYAQLTFKAFSDRIDSLQLVMTQIAHRYLEKKSFTAGAKNTLLKSNQAVIAALKANYVVIHHSDIGQFGIPDSLKDMKRWMVFDATLLESNLPVLNPITEIFLNHEIYRPLLDNADESEIVSIYKNCASLSAKRIIALSLKKETTQFLLAANINHWLDLFGPTPDIQENFIAYCHGDASESLKVVLNKKFTLWHRIGPGQKAPDITGKDIHDKQINLTDLRGKVVYVDVWATWCGPCVAEMPDARKLHEEFKNENVIFLNVSIDRDVDQWKKFVNEKLVDSGLHINDSQAKILVSYLNSGVPRHILIDASGKICKPIASGPGSPEARAEILAALKEGK